MTKRNSKERTRQTIKKQEEILRVFWFFQTSTLILSFPVWLASLTLSPTRAHAALLPLYLPRCFAAPSSYLLSISDRGGRRGQRRRLKDGLKLGNG